MSSRSHQDYIYYLSGTRWWMNCKIYKICNDILCILCYNKQDRDINASINILRKGIELLSKDGTHPDSLFMLDPLGSSRKKPPLL